MDSQNFRKQTSPNLIPSVSSSVTEKAVNEANVPELKITAPIPDQRYPQYATVMHDGRLATDYRPRCALNTVAPKYGNSMRSWFQHNTDALIQVSRKRQADRVGAQYMKAATVPAARQLQQCDEYECKFLKNTQSGSIGLERVEGVPPLFGTFSDPRHPMPSSGSFLTTNYEGGRNTPRGQSFRQLGNLPVFPNDDYNYN